MAFLLSRTIGAVPVSLIETEEHKSELEITSLPVESGADITDHAYVKPKTVTLKGLIGNGYGGFRGSFITAAGYQALVRYQAARRPFYLVTGINVYKDMLIQSITVPRDSLNANVLEFTVVCKQVKIIGSGFGGSILGAILGGQAAGIAAATLAVGVISQRASPTVKRGDNVVKPANTDDTSQEGRRNKSALARVGL